MTSEEAIIRLFIVIFALAVATSAQAMSPAPLNQPDSHGHSSPRSMWCRFSHGQWYLRAYCCPPERRQVCGWDAHSGWPLRQMKCQKAKSCKQANLRFEQPKEV